MSPKFLFLIVACGSLVACAQAGQDELQSPASKTETPPPAAERPQLNPPPQIHPPPQATRDRFEEPAAAPKSEAPASKSDSAPAQVEAPVPAAAPKVEAKVESRGEVAQESRVEFEPELKYEPRLERRTEPLPERRGDDSKVTRGAPETVLQTPPLPETTTVIAEQNFEPVTFDPVEPDVQSTSQNRIQPEQTAHPQTARPQPKPQPEQTKTQSQGLTALEATLLKMLNSSRAQAGLPPFKFSRLQSSGSAKCIGSQGHSVHMAQVGHLTAHDQFPQDICVRTSSSGENEGWATGSAQQALSAIHKLMMDEGPGGGHYQNIMSNRYNTVGLGFSYVNGGLYVTENFLWL